MCALIGLDHIMSLTNQSLLTEEHYHEVHLKHTDRKYHPTMDLLWDKPFLLYAPSVCVQKEIQNLSLNTK